MYFKFFLKLLILLGCVCLGLAEIFPCERRRTSQVVGKYKCVKLEKNSRFVFLTKKPSVDFTYLNAEEECKNVGLSLAEFKHPSDFIALEAFLIKAGGEYANNLTRFWHSAVSTEDGKWEYGNPNHEAIHFNAFWGLTSYHVPTQTPATGPSSYGMLQWVTSEGQEKPTLVMIDAELDNAFTQKSFICEFPADSECYTRSMEEKFFQVSQAQGATIDQLPGMGDNKFYLSKRQMVNSEARTFCETNGMTLLELTTTTKEGSNLSASINEKMHIAPGKSVGFWIGGNDLFNYIGDFKWTWLEDKYLGSLSQPGFSPEIPFGRIGWHRYIGKCLAASIPNRNQTEWFLQPVSCHLPQWTICQKAPETLPAPEEEFPDTEPAVRARGRGAGAYPEQNFTMNCDKYADGKWRVYPKEDCFRSFRCHCENKVWAIDLFPCAAKKYVDPTKIPSVCILGKNPYVGKPECDWPERLPGKVQLPCSPQVKFKCRKVGTFLHPDCSKYYSCKMVNEKLKTYVLDCPKGHYFNATRNKCVSGSCEPFDMSCTKDGIFPIPGACDMFYQCIKFPEGYRNYTRHCKAGSHFNPKKSQCEKGPCGGAPVTSTTIGPMTTRKYTRAVTTTTTTTVTTPSASSSSTTTEAPSTTVTTVTTSQPVTTEWTTTVPTTTELPTISTTTERMQTFTPRPEPSSTVSSSITTMCTEIEVSTVEITTPTPTTTTEIPYTALECKKRGTIDHQFGEVRIKRVGRSSKFVHLDYENRGNTSYYATKMECEKWNLDLPEIKSKVDLEAIESFLHLHFDGSANTDLSYWISGADEGRNGIWKYTTNNRERIKFQNFWGMTPLYMTSTVASPDPEHLMIRWQSDEETETKKLFMLDVGPNDEFYEKNGIICQFPVTNADCNQNSNEEIQFRSQEHLKDFPDDLGFLKGQNHYAFSNKVQKTRAEAAEFCKVNHMELIDIRSLDETDINDLFTFFYDYAGKYSAFWIGSNDLFNEKSPVPWDWVNNQVTKPWEDTVLKQGDQVREGRPRNFGKCLVLGTIDNKESRFYLQHSLCDLPQHAVCTEPHVNLG